MNVKNRVSFVTHQECIDAIIPGMRASIAGPFEGPRGRKQYYSETAKKLEALPKPLREEDVKRVLKEALFPDGWWNKSFKPGCDLCEEQHDWVMVIHEALEDEYPMDLSICSDCLNELLEKKVEFLEEYLEELKGKLGVDDQTTVV